MCSFNGRQWIGAVYFPRGEKSFSIVKSKFEHDLQGVEKNDAVGIAFVTNQEITVANRKELEDITGMID